MAGKYGYWTFNNKNALVGAPTTIVYGDDGTPYYHKDPELPAVLQDEYIINAIMTSSVARVQFNQLYPTLDSRSQQRLSDLLKRFPRAQQQLDSPWLNNRSPQALADAEQKKQVTAGIHTNVPRKGK